MEEEESVDADYGLLPTACSSGFDFNGVAEELNKICANEGQTCCMVTTTILLWCVVTGESLKKKPFELLRLLLLNNDYIYLTMREEEVDRRLEEINNGIADLSEGGKQLVGEETNEFSSSPCECCGEKIRLVHVTK